jgi:pyruvate dehydrogenase kinase 2/3/4
MHLPESKPNPSIVDTYSHDHGFTSSTSGNGNNGSGFNKVRLRVPMERRYYANTHGITQWPPEIQDYNKRFTKMLENIKSRHDPTVTTVAQGVLEWKRSQNARHIGLDMQAWLDRFYMSRIGIRFLIGQHVALNTQQAHEDYVGIICTKANVHDIVQESIENARFVCEEHYAMFKGPPVQLICPPSLTFAYVPGHLSHICFELLKNSLRAVVERYGVDSEDSGGYPPIKVIVVEGKEDITIKISDEGGGIARSAIPLIWTYMYTTMESQSLDQDFQASDFKAPMAGFGYGLPLSRLVRSAFIHSPFLSLPSLSLTSALLRASSYIPRTRVLQGSPCLPLLPRPRTSTDPFLAHQRSFSPSVFTCAPCHRAPHVLVVFLGVQDVQCTF